MNCWYSFKNEMWMSQQRRYYSIDKFSRHMSMWLINKLVPLLTSTCGFFNRTLNILLLNFSAWSIYNRCSTCLWKWSEGQLDSQWSFMSIVIEHDQALSNRLQILKNSAIICMCACIRECLVYSGRFMHAEWRLIPCAYLPIFFRTDIYTRISSRHHRVHRNDLQSDNVLFGKIFMYVYPVMVFILYKSSMIIGA
jgi:hypothetical protein